MHPLKSEVYGESEQVAIGWKQIGRALGLSASTCQRKRKQLLEEGAVFIWTLGKFGRGWQGSHKTYMALQGNIRRYCMERAAKGETVF
jgi:hypothetical protein